MTDSEKLIKLAAWFDSYDWSYDNKGTEVQDDLRRIAKELESKERFKMPNDKTIIDFAILFNDGNLEPSKLADMVAMCQCILNRLYEHGDIMIKAKQEIEDEKAS